MTVYLISEIENDPTIPAQATRHVLHGRRRVHPPTQRPAVRQPSHARGNHPTTIEPRFGHFGGTFARTRQRNAVLVPLGRLGPPIWQGNDDPSIHGGPIATSVVVPGRDVRRPDPPTTTPCLDRVQDISGSGGRFSLSNHRFGVPTLPSSPNPVHARPLRACLRRYH
jgi:hypothetical protein